MDSFKTSQEGPCSHTQQVASIVTEMASGLNPHGRTAAESSLNKGKVGPSTHPHLLD